MMREMLVASHNAGKVREIEALLAPLAIKVTSAAALNLPEPEETGDTFEANAELKAKAACEASRLPSLADDSGLVVPALDGDPGIYSARWAGPSKDFTAAMRQVESRLAAKGVTPTGTPAYFVCVLALQFPKGNAITVRGEVHGTLTFPPRGDQGFGYDPMFMAKGETVTFGEMEQTRKHAISHRAIAFAKLLDALKAEAA
jgi:XTP/dITP diphosphohydrolase